jgi:hypothetical protein
MQNAFDWLKLNGPRIYGAMIAADFAARSQGWHEPVWVAATLAGLGVLLAGTAATVAGVKYGVRLLSPPKLARKRTK